MNEGVSYLWTIVEYSQFQLFSSIDVHQEKFRAFDICNSSFPRKCVCFIHAIFLFLCSICVPKESIALPILNTCDEMHERVGRGQCWFV